MKSSSLETSGNATGCKDLASVSAKLCQSGVHSTQASPESTCSGVGSAKLSFNAAIESWDSWEDFDTASEGPAEGDLEPSEASFCTQSESDFSFEGVDSWEDLEEESSMVCGPLDRLIQKSKDAPAGMDPFKELL